MKVDCLKFDLQLKDPFTIARGTVEVQPTMIVRVERDGLVGYGEATTNEFYGVTFEAMESALERVRSKLANCKLDDPAALWQELDADLASCRFAQCALDCAVWDLFAKQRDLPLWKLWNLDSSSCPPTCFTIGLDSPEEMVRKLGDRPGWPVYKIKLDSSGGLDLVRRLREHTESTFRVDANCSWDKEQVQSLAFELADLNVELIEQPLEHLAYDEMRDLKGRCAIPLMADESCQVETDVDRCLNSFDAINIKLVKCGGLTPARRMIARAKEHGLQVMVGCMTESSIGISAGAHLLPLLDFADLDGALLLAEDIASGLMWTDGYCELPLASGLGVELI